jgi:hypothetical protein
MKSLLKRRLGLEVFNYYRLSVLQEKEFNPATPEEIASV